MNFNPIIVLFLTGSLSCYGVEFVTFQSYYSLISNQYLDVRLLLCLHYFNPIIVLFLTIQVMEKAVFLLKFQSYYSLISNQYSDLFLVEENGISILL